jgi:hypothetical protein
MYIDGAKMFEKDWDLEFLKFKNQMKSISSGSHEIVFNKDNYKFYPDYKKIKITTARKVDWVSKDFFFVHFQLFKFLPDISMFKYHGAEECISLFAAYEGISVVAVPTDLVVDKEPNISENDFLPFSLYHNYSKVIDCFKLKGDHIPGVKELMRIIDYDFSSLNYFPYPVNDIEYDFFSNLDKASEQRFHTVQNRIY